MAIETYFKNIADAIRARSGSGALITPGNMPGAVADIPGGGVDFETPYSRNLHNGFVVGSTYSYSGGAYPNVFSDVYQLQPGDSYLAFLGDTVSNRFRAIQCASDPVITTTDINGTTVLLTDNPPAFTGAYFKALVNYFVVTKTTNGIDIPTYLLNITNLLEG